MTETRTYCERCGTQLLAGANFCEVCGSQVPRPVPTQAHPVAQSTAPPAPAPIPNHQRNPDPAYRTPAPAPPAYYPPASPPKSRSLLWPILGGGCCLGIVCSAVTVVGLLIFANTPDGEIISRMLTPESSEVIDSGVLPSPELEGLNTATPTAAPDILPSETPPLALSTEPAEPLNPVEPVSIWPEPIGQDLSGTNFQDDFSTNMFDWAVVEDDVASYSLEEGRYAIHVFQGDYASWAYLPPEFDPSFIGFDAAVLPGQDAGAYGVICFYQDEDNYHFVSINPTGNEYSIGYQRDGIYYELMQDMWMPSFYLNDAPHAVNHIQIGCDPDMITLFINNELEAQTQIEWQDGGRVAIFAETWNDIGPEGFKVLFDNLFAFIPVQ